MKRKLNIDIVPSIKKLQIVTKGLIKTKGMGSYKSVFRGKGLDFSEYRPYDNNDDALLIDWKASMRTNQILIRQYEEERDLNVFFVVDCSSGMVFGSTDKLKNEYAAELVISLAFTILDAGDSVGLVMFSDKVVKKVYPGKGRGQFYSMIKTLSDPNNYGGGFDFDNVTDFILNYIKPSSIVIFLSDFVGLKESSLEKLKLITNKYDTVGVMVRDPRDKILPEDAGQVVIEDPYSNKSLLIEPKLIKEVYEEEIKKQEKWIKDSFMINKSDFLSLTTDKSFVKPVIGLFMERTIKWR